MVSRGSAPNTPLSAAAAGAPSEAADAQSAAAGVQPVATGVQPVARQGGRRRLPPEERREAILRTAVRMGLEIGLDRLTSRQIGTEAGVTGALVNHYFPHMDDLVAAAFAHAASQEIRATFANVEQCSAPPARLRRLIDLYFAEDGQEVNRLWLDAWSMAPRRPALHAEVQRQMDHWVDRLAPLIVEGVETGDFRSADPAASARRLLALLDGVAVHTVLARAVDHDDSRSLVLAAAEHELGTAPGTLRDPTG
ncbi:TetR/AcrR family transcriptional regulator [Streptomyces sp. G5(2025)]|uniref:TetR/AcrR family transcriptional regulator n=1 Tax=Streptomyces sp. G5(2025) TaxID=3406628 RepID=UPI003C279C96